MPYTIDEAVSKNLKKSDLKLSYYAKYLDLEYNAPKCQDNN